jgi:hypothetical protein
VSMGTRARGRGLRGLRGEGHGDGDLRFSMLSWFPL